jgi:phosphatidylglycerol lysyltransferase
MRPDNAESNPRGRWLRALRYLPTLLGLGLLGGAIYVVWNEFRHLKLEQVGAALHGIPMRAVAIAALWTFLAYFVLTFYDRLGTYYAGKRVSYRRAAFASFCAYALSHNLGLAAVSGAAVRYRLYSNWGLSPVQIAKVVAFCSLTFGLGGMVLGGVILWIEPSAVPFFGKWFPAWLMHGIGSLMWLVVAGYITVSSFFGTIRLFGHTAELPHWRMSLLQVALATVDVAVTASIFYALLPASHGLTWLRFVGVYLACYSAGLMANLPGGLGVFDGAMLIGLQPWLDAPHVLGAIVVFRLFYYVIPLFLAGSLFAGNELLIRGESFWRRLRGRPAVGAVVSWAEPDFTVAALTGAVTLCGVLLLALGELVPRPTFAWIDPSLADVAAEAGQFVPSLIGAGLLVLALGLSQRVTLAWGATLVLLLVGAVFGIAEGERLWVPGVLVLAAILVAPFRPLFYRHARLLAGPLSAETTVPLLALIGCVLALAAFERHVRFYAENAWWEIVLSPAVPNATRATIAVAVGLAAAAIWGLIRPGRVTWLPWNAEARLRLASLGGRPAEAAEGLVLGESGAAGIAFRRCGRILLAFGDPAGARTDQVSAVWRLRDLAKQEGRDPAIWRAGPDLLKVYGDLGLTALLLGPDGLPTGGDAPPDRRGQYLVCVAERDLKMLLPLLPGLDTKAERRADAPVVAVAE